jgi:hypothetical protein
VEIAPVASGRPRATALSITPGDPWLAAPT